MIYNEKWPLKTLKECCEYISRGKQPKYVEHSEIMTLNQKAIQWDGIDKKSLKYHNNEVSVQEKHFIKKDDLVLNSTGTGTVGRCYIFSEQPKNRLFADSHVTIIRTKKEILLPEFLYYQLSTTQYQNLIYSSFLSGSTGQVELNKSKVQLLPVYVPEIEVQKKIIRILSLLDKKIELNSHTIINLKDFSSAVFKHWFIEYEFPDTENKPYKSNGGSMIQSEIGNIPSNWKIKSLDEIATVKGGKRLPKGEKVQEKVTPHPYIRVKDFTGRTIKRENINYISAEIQEKIKKYTISSEDIYISVVGTVGITGLIPKSFDGANLTENANKITLIDTKISKYFVLEFLNFDVGKNQIHSKVVGSTQPKLPLYAIKDIKIVIPKNELLLNKANSIFEKMYSKIEFLQDNNQTLKAIRNTLLPEILSGKIEIPKNLEVE